VTEGLQERIERDLSVRTGGPVAVRAIERLAGGACQELFRVDLEISCGERAGARRMVLRSDAVRRLPGSLDRRDEYRVIELARAAGVPTPPARWVSSGLVREGAWAYFMDWVDGEAIGRRVVKRPELAAARERLPLQLASALARVHSLSPGSAPGLALAGAEGEKAPARTALDFLVGALERLPEPRPALELVLRWLLDEAPAREERTLVHGDFRTGNFMVGPEGLRAVLDWEFAHFGNPMEDLAWMCVRDWRFGELDKPAGGLTRREPFYEAYERSSGRAVRRDEVRWWEVFGNARWAAGSILQGERYLSGEETDLELVAIARRAVEMEFEALRIAEGARP